MTGIVQPGEEKMERRSYQHLNISKDFLFSTEMVLIVHWCFGCC